MQTRKHVIITFVAASTMALTACGGAGGGVASTPPPPSSPPPSTPTTQPSPTPPPNPTPPPLPSGAIGLTDGPFSTYSVGSNGDAATRGKDAVAISYSPDSNTYTFSAPGVGPGQLVDPAVNSGSWLSGSTAWQTISNTSSRVSAPAGTPGTTTVILDWVAPPYSTSDLSYTSFGTWIDSNGARGNDFVYGTPTAHGSVPVTGTASYNASIRGTVSGQSDWGLLGGMKFVFDFGAGTLSGSMTPETTDGWEVKPLGTYTFRDTVFSKSATTFSGAFTVPGSTAASAFEGRFNGPSASELMGNFNAPYLSPTDQTWQTMVGVFAGRKAP